MQLFSAEVPSFLVVVLNTLSRDMPTTEGALAQQPLGGGDGYVAMLKDDGSALVYGTYVGGKGDDWAVSTTTRPSTSRAMCTSPWTRPRPTFPSRSHGQHSIGTCSYNDECRFPVDFRGVSPATSFGTPDAGWHRCLGGYAPPSALKMASMHGSYRKVEETLPAIYILGELISKWNVATCRWLLDKPVSNSGRLKTMLRRTAASRGLA